jgi:hypothetical protein
MPRCFVMEAAMDDDGDGDLVADLGEGGGGGGGALCATLTQEDS